MVMRAMRACACGERTNAAYRAPGQATSSVKVPSPRSSRASSRRGSARPTYGTEVQASISRVAFEVWDAELGVCLGSYVSRGDALAAVRRLLASSHGSVAPLGLIENQQRII